MLEAREAIVRRIEAHLFHGEQVLVDGTVGVGEDGRKLVLRGRNFVVLGLGCNAELPQIVVELFHEFIDRGADGTEVVLIELLAFARRRAEERTTGHDQVVAAFVILFSDEEILLLGADRSDDLVAVFAEETQHALCLRVDRAHGAQKWRLLVERFAGVGAEGRGDAEHLVLDEGRARGIPRSIATCFEGGAKATVWKARGIGLALDELLAREGHDGRAIAHGVQEAVVLFGGDARKRLEPVRIMRGTVFDRPFFHGVRDHVRHLDIERLSLFDRFREVLVRLGWETLLHDVVVEDQGSEDL